ncbi:MAG: aldose epimerase family protein [Coriobacteriia bacterium]
MAQSDEIGRKEFGSLDGKPVSLFTLTNRRGVTLRLTDYGAAIVGLTLPDRDGNFADVVLGFDDLRSYLEHTAHFGATIGRVANRIRNAEFTLGENRYRLAANDPPDSLHGGARGWDKRVWEVKSAMPAPPADEDVRSRGSIVEFTYASEDGEEGYPGRVEAFVRYILLDENEIRIEMRAETDKATLVNLTNHTYWNLGGHDSGDVLDHELSISADSYTPGDPLVPIGMVEPVEGTPFDFRTPKPIGADIGRVESGYDHNFVVNGPACAIRPVAHLWHPGSGRELWVKADKGGVQLYSGNNLEEDIAGKGGAHYGAHAGLCLESQAFPNAINVPEWASQVILRPGSVYEHTIIFRFAAR